MYDFLYNVGDRVVSAYPAWLNNILCDAPDVIYLLTMQEEIVGVEAIILTLLLLAGIIWKISTFTKKAACKPKKTKTQKPVNAIKKPMTEKPDISEQAVIEEPSIVEEKNLSPDELKKQQEREHRKQQERERSLKVILDAVGEDEYNAHKESYDHIAEVGCIREDGKFYDLNCQFFRLEYKKWIAYEKLEIEPDYEYMDTYIRENALLFEKLYPEEAQAIKGRDISDKMGDILSKDLAEKIIATLNGEDRITDEDIERYRMLGDSQHECSLQTGRAVWNDFHRKIEPDNYTINKYLDECERTNSLGQLKSIHDCEERIRWYDNEIKRLQNYQKILSSPPVTQVMEEVHLLEMYNAVEKAVKQNESVISRLNDAIKMAEERKKKAQAERERTANTYNTYEPEDFNSDSYNDYPNRNSYEDTYDDGYNDNSYSSDDDSSYNSFGDEAENYIPDPPSNNNNLYEDYSDYWHNNNGWHDGLSGDPDEDQWFYQ